MKIGILRFCWGSTYRAHELSSLMHHASKGRPMLCAPASIAVLSGISLSTYGSLLPFRYLRYAWGSSYSAGRTAAGGSGNPTGRLFLVMYCSVFLWAALRLQQGNMGHQRGAKYCTQVMQHASDRQFNWQAGKPTCRQRRRQTGRQTDEQTGRSAREAPFINMVGDEYVFWLTEAHDGPVHLVHRSHLSKQTSLLLISCSSARCRHMHSHIDCVIVPAGQAAGFVH